MAYASLSDVQRLVPTLQFGPQTLPSSDDVTATITTTASEIDAALASRGLAVPVASPAQFLADMTRLNAQGTAALIYLTAFPPEMGTGQTATGPIFWNAYQKRLAELRQGIGIPAEAVFATDLQAPRSYITDEGADNNQEATDEFGRHIHAEPFFTVEKRF